MPCQSACSGPERTAQRTRKPGAKRENRSGRDATARGERLGNHRHRLDHHGLRREDRPERNAQRRNPVAEGVDAALRRRERQHHPAGRCRTQKIALGTRNLPAHLDGRVLLFETLYRRRRHQRRIRRNQFQFGRSAAEPRNDESGVKNDRTGRFV